jgi:hypothetical protein
MDRPGEDGAEQNDPAEIAICHELCERPQLYTDEHRVPEPT